jgi:hypothetical protein
VNSSGSTLTPARRLTALGLMTDFLQVRQFFFINRGIAIFENRSACSTQGTPVREATGWFFFD